MSRITLRYEFQLCRTWGHAWDDFNPGVGKRPAAWGRRFSLLCTRCGMERHDTFDARGELSTRHYDQPQDYKLAADETPTLQQLRLSVIREMKVQHEHRVTRAPARQPRKKQRRLSAVS